MKAMRATLRSNVVTGTLFWLFVVALVGAVDLSTGPDYGFGFFYLLAVVPAAWLLGRRPGIAVALASGCAWFFADVIERRVGSLGPAAWNASSRLFLFVLAAWLVDIVRRERVRLRSLDRERSHFMRVLEHELAGPGEELSRGLRGLQDSGGATASELQPLVERAQDLEFLSRDFVSLGQLQSGELWLQHRPVDLGALVEELRTRPSDKGPRIPITLSSGRFIVEGDEARLRQAIGSLLNEARAAKTSDVSIDLRRDGGNVKLTITGGIGRSSRCRRTTAVASASSSRASSSKAIVAGSITAARPRRRRSASWWSCRFADPPHLYFAQRGTPSKELLWPTRSPPT